MTFRLQWGLAVAAVLLLAPVAQAQLQSPFPGGAIPQFVQPLPQLSAAGGSITTVSGNGSLTMRMCEFKARILPPGTFSPGVQPETWVWGYVPGDSCPTTTQDTYFGPVVVATRNVPTEVRYVNELGDASATNVLAYKKSVDQTLDWADPLNDEANACAKAETIPAYGSYCASNYAGPVPAVAHLHGGEVPAEIDGGPMAWFTSDGNYQGSAYYSAPFTSAGGNEAVYRYPNSQEAAPLWFHDHTLGATRLNVYAGLAGAWVLTDPDMNLPANLPGPAETIPLVIQDRMFDTNGQLFYPADSYGGILWVPNPDHPYWVPEHIGDTIVVNGKAWPYLNVEPRRYRFIVLNGSQARTYALFLENRASETPGPSMYVIATDGGYLDAPAPLNAAGGEKLIVMPGERYEVIIDFGGLPAGTNLVMRNTARNPYPFGDTPKGSTDGRIMQFRVTCGASGCPTTDESYDPAAGTPLRSGTDTIKRLVNPATGTLPAGVTVDQNRQLTLNEVMKGPSTAIDPVTGLLTDYPGGPLKVLLNNTPMMGSHTRTHNDFVPVSLGNLSLGFSELPEEGETEIWEFVNLTADAHPIHLHLVQFQLLNRQNFNVNRYTKAYEAAFPAVAGDPVCTGGVFCPGFGPPLDYNTGNPRALGGNPDITPYLQGPVRAPLPQEAGWKDTIVALPGTITRIAVRWAPTDIPVAAPASQTYFPFDPSNSLGYVWHCHILDHEDNEMMRPFLVELNPLAPIPPLRPFVKGIDY